MKVLCEDCNGHGLQDSWDEDLGREVKTNCETCDGQGWHRTNESDNDDDDQPEPTS